jgi:hypothetical protein
LKCEEGWFRGAVCVLEPRLQARKVAIVPKLEIEVGYDKRVGLGRASDSGYAHRRTNLTLVSGKEATETMLRYLPVATTPSTPASSF